MEGGGGLVDRGILNGMAMGEGVGLFPYTVYITHLH